MKVLVFGASGMLGKYISTYLKGNEFNVQDVGRKDVDANDTRVQLQKFIQENTTSGDVIINCMGTIKPRVADVGEKATILTNSIFPRELADLCAQYNIHLIHPTTDCVYDGLDGNYNEESKHNIDDVYGMSKSLGEPFNATVIRTSIIGEEVKQGRSLVEWVKSEKGNSVFGFTNHMWNGVTCLQFAKICEDIINNNEYWYGVRHIHSNTLNKKELVETISEVYDLGMTVVPKETETKCDRSLSSIYEHQFNIPSLRDQIIEMKDFSPVLYGKTISREETS